MTDQLLAAELDFFERPAHVQNVAGARAEIIQPTFMGNSYPGMCQFHIPKTESQFTSTKFYLRTKFRVLKKNDQDETKNLEDTDNVALINYSHMTMWSRLEFLVNNVTIQNSGGNWPYLSYLKTLLSTSIEQKKQQMADLTNFNMDSSPDGDNIGEDTNPGRWTRRFRVSGSKLCCLYGLVPLDICTSPKLLVPGCSMELKLHHAPDQFRIHAEKSDVNYFLHLDSAELTVQRYTLQTELAKYVERRLLKGDPIQYDISRPCILGPMEIIAGQNQYKCQVSLSRRCSALIIFMTKSKVGEDYKFNPFVFQHNKAKRVQVLFEGWFA